MTVATYPWAASGRAQAIGRTEGLTPVDHRSGYGMRDRLRNGRRGAGELIAEGALAIEMSCEVRDITETVHAHPTLSETLMNAGEVFYGTATETTSRVGIEANCHGVRNPDFKIDSRDWSDASGRTSGLAGSPGGCSTVAAKRHNGTA